MTEYDSFDPGSGIDFDKLRRDPSVKFIPGIFGGVVGDYPPGELCGLVLTLAGTILLQHPGMTDEECERALLKMEYDHEYCITINGTFGLRSQKPFTKFEMYFAGIIINKARERNIPLLNACTEMIAFGIRQLEEASNPGGRAVFKAYKEKTGHIWFYIESGTGSAPHGLPHKLAILVEEINGAVRCVLGEKRSDIHVNYPLTFK